MELSRRDRSGDRTVNGDDKDRVTDTGREAKDSRFPQVTTTPVGDSPSRIADCGS